MWWDAPWQTHEEGGGGCFPGLEIVYKQKHVYRAEFWTCAQQTGCEELTVNVCPAHPWRVKARILVAEGEREREREMLNVKRGACKWMSMVLKGQNTRLCTDR